MSLGRESHADHDHIPKKASILKVCACEGFSCIGVSVPSLHKESTDSLILMCVALYLLYTYLVYSCRAQIIQ